ncbi:ESX secretion-associated protein EspG [Solihabitans fulvus]|uniref:ESX secretion-associated protein EspG n=1 Tax=Solihabitans fulvus TaxID=1892852 RepID=A0A5B2XGS0_9PSEU|nr:ESX secretion-associated protein EspG [Solihabitans fulvus]KAA2262364.1 ESX secretion-associated protein EspG [Solihabitans fulvus]
MDSIATLSLPAFDVLWEDLRLGPIPYPLEVRAHGETLDERAGIRAAVHAELARVGLFRHGRVAPDLEDALRLLAGPALRLDALIMLDLDDEEPVKATVAVRRGHAVRAVQRDRAIGLDRVRDTAAAASVVELAPANRPGAGRSVTLPASAVDHGRGNHARLSQQERAQLRELEVIMARPVLRTGQFGVAAGHGAALPGVSWFDTDAGRYLNSVRAGRDGERWVTVAPADNPRIAHRLGEILAEAAGR